MLAFFLGCNPIYFIGCDHDFYAITKENYESSHIRHFYPQAKTSGHIERLAWEEWDRCMEIMKQQYKYLNQYASRWGFNVFNATRGGYLDEFPRVEYESLFPPKTAAGASLNSGNHTADPVYLSRSASVLMNTGDYRSALVLLNEAVRKNTNRTEKADGLEYLKAICLAKLHCYDESLMFAHQDYQFNPSNRDNSSRLIQRLENITRTDDDFEDIFKPIKITSKNPALALLKNIFLK
jgi:tetratricopeptide (TPR) repeat protein